MTSAARAPWALWFGWTIALSLVFGRIAAYNLGNYRPVSNDEMELMAVAYKLATQGVLGSDLYAGFAGADQHFMITLPLQHLFEAASFRLFGAGVAQMRWVSVVAGVALVWVVSWLAYRWYGLSTAIICGLLLVAWPSNLTAAPNGLPLLGVTRAARYDVLAVLFAWLAVALLDVVVLRRPRPALGFGLGICCGLAALAQFMGAFALPLVALNWSWARGRRGPREPTLYWIVAGATAVWLPWLLFVAQYRADFAAQLTVFGDRLDVLSPEFYVTNIFSEARRYQDLLRLGPAEDPGAPNSLGSQLLLATAALPAVAYIAWRSRRTRAMGDRLLWSSLVIFGGLLLLVDHTKTPLYAIILVPAVCMALAATSTALWYGVRRWRAWIMRGALVCLGIVVAADGWRAYQVYVTKAALASPYLGVGVELEAGLPPGAHVLGPERWWWALHAHPYASLRSVWWQWWAAAPAAEGRGGGNGQGQLPQFAYWVNVNQADAIIVNDNIRDDVNAFPEALQQQFWAFISACTTQVLDLTDASYLRIEVDRITRPPPDLEVCGGTQ